MAGKKFVKVSGLSEALENIVISAGTASLKASAIGDIIDGNSILFIQATAADSSLGVASGSKWIFAKGMLFNAQNAQFEKLANYEKAASVSEIAATDTVVSAFGKVQKAIDELGSDIHDLTTANTQAHNALQDAIDELNATAVKSIIVGQGLDVSPAAGTGNTLTISHEDSSASASAGTSVGDGTHVAQVAIDSMGHVTAITAVELTHKTISENPTAKPTSVTAETSSASSTVSAVTSVNVDEFGHVISVDGIKLGTAANRGVASAITSGSENLATSKAVYEHVQEAVADLAGAMHFIGATSDENVFDGSNAQTITVGGESYEAKAGDVVVKGDKEFVWTKSGAWAELGDITPDVVVNSIEGLTGAIDLAGSDGITVATGANNTITIGVAAETYDNFGAAASAKTAVEGTSSDTSAATTVAGAKAYAKDYVDAETLKSISATGDSYVSASASTKANNAQEITVATHIQAVEDADATHMGLAEASDVKSYVDGKVTGTFSPITSAESDWGEFPAA